MKRKNENFNFKYVCPVIEVNALCILIGKLRKKWIKKNKNKTD